MLFKKRKDNVKRCSEGHIQDPSWDTCPYCEDDDSSRVLEPGTGSSSGANGELTGAAAPFPPSPPAAGPPIPRAPVPGPPPPPSPQSYSPPPAAPMAINTPPASPPDYDDLDDLTVVGFQPAQAQPQPTLPQPPQPESPPSPTPPPAPELPSPALSVSEPKAAAEKYGLHLAWLIVVSGDYRNRDFRLTSGAVIVGTGQDCGIRLAGEQFISARHGEFTLLGDQCHYRDLNSTNGSFVDNEKLDEIALTDGDAVRLGNTKFVFKCLSI